MKARYPHSVDHGEYDNYHEATDTNDLREEIYRMSKHITETWPKDEQADAVGVLTDIVLRLVQFDALVEQHRERVLKET